MWPVDSSLTHIIVIKVGKYTFGGHLLVEMFWWKKFLLRLPDTGRKVWANFTEDTFPPSPGMIPEKSTKINNLAGPPGDGGEVLVGGKYGKKGAELYILIGFYFNQYETKCITANLFGLFV